MPSSSLLFVHAHFELWIHANYIQKKKYRLDDVSLHVQSSSQCIVRFIADIFIRITSILMAFKSCLFWVLFRLQFGLFFSHSLFDGRSLHSGCDDDFLTFTVNFGCMCCLSWHCDGLKCFCFFFFYDELLAQLLSLLFLYATFSGSVKVSIILMDNFNGLLLRNMWGLLWICFMASLGVCFDWFISGLLEHWLICKFNEKW